MTHWPVFFRTAPGERRLAERGVDLTLLLLLVLMPLMFGGLPAGVNFSLTNDPNTLHPLLLDVVFPGGEAIFVTLAGVAMILSFIHLLRSGGRLVRGASLVPIVLFVLLVIGHLIEWPGRTIESLSPGHGWLASQIIQGDGPSGISVYREATVQQLRVLLGVVAVFLAVLNTYRTADSLERLAVILLTAAGVQGIIALTQQLSAAQGIFWSLPVAETPRGGTFINRNNFAQFANLGVGAGLGLLLCWRARWKRYALDGARNSLAAMTRDPAARPLLLVLGMSVLIALASVLSFSRMGAGALAVGLVTVTLLAGSDMTRSQRGSLAILAIAGVLLGALLIGSDLWVQRLVSSTDEFELRAGSRLEILRDLMPLYARFWSFGSGLGSFYWIFPVFDSSRKLTAVEYADNDYAQLLAETGVVGLALALVFIGVVLRGGLRAVWAGGSSGLLACGLLGGLVAVLVQSFADLGQHLPAVAAMTACCCAALISLGYLKLPKPPRFRHRPSSLAVMSVMTLAVGWAMVDAVDTAIAEREFVRAYAMEWRLRRLQPPWSGTDEEYRRLIGHARAASRRRPGNAYYAYWLHEYLYRAVTTAAVTTSGVSATDARLDPLPQDALYLVQRFESVARLTPTWSPPITRAADLLVNELGDPRGRALVERATRLSRTDPDAAWLAAGLALRDGRLADALAWFDLASTLDGSWREPAVFKLLEAGHVAEAIQLASGQLDSIRRLNRQLKERAHPLAPLAAGRYRETLEAAVLDRPGAAVLAELATVVADQSDHPRAVELLTGALLLEPTHASWRLALVRSLRETGNFGRALNELQVILRQRPDDPALLQLQTELRLLERDSARGP